MEEEELRKEVNQGESRICVAGDQINHLIKSIHEKNGCHLNTNDTNQQTYSTDLIGGLP